MRYGICDRWGLILANYRSVTSALLLSASQRSFLHISTSFRLLETRKAPHAFSFFTTRLVGGNCSPDSTLSHVAYSCGTDRKLGPNAHFASQLPYPRHDLNQWRTRTYGASEPALAQLKGA